MKRRTNNLYSNANLSRSQFHGWVNKINIYCNCEAVLTLQREISSYSGKQGQQYCRLVVSFRNGHSQIIYFINCMYNTLPTNQLRDNDKLSKRCVLHQMVMSDTSITIYGLRTQQGDSVI